jgi:hypothetical protein
MVPLSFVNEMVDGLAWSEPAEIAASDLASTRLIEGCVARLEQMQTQLNNFAISVCNSLTHLERGVSHLGQVVAADKAKCAGGQYGPAHEGAARTSAEAERLAMEEVGAEAVAVETAPAARTHAEQQGSEGHGVWLAVGQTIFIRGLASKPELNGCGGKIIQACCPQGRYGVRISGFGLIADRDISVQRKNLSLTLFDTDGG